MIIAKIFDEHKPLLGERLHSLDDVNPLLECEIFLKGEASYLSKKLIYK